MSKLEQRIERLEKVLFDIALHKNRCKYIYQIDLKEALIRRKIYNEKEIGKRIWELNKPQWHTPLQTKANNSKIMKKLQSVKNKYFKT